jgi:mannose/fructose/N-acetylgalactosamine-specific phosphotransferase system component IIC
LDIDYPEKLDRFSTFFRLIWAIPILIVAGLVSATSSSTVTTVVVSETGKIVTQASESGGGIVGGLFAATLLMIVFRQRYPRWWFDFGREFARFGMRVGAYMALLTDEYPSTTDEQSIHLELDYPDVEQDLNRFLPLVKWLLAIPHYIVLAFLAIGAILAIFIAWFAVLFTGRYPRGLFDYVVGVARWALRIQAYAILLVTDRYPPFSLK